MHIVLATNNRHKAREILSILGEDRYQLLLQQEVIQEPLEVEETGATLEENAYLKALSVFIATGMPALADDTGLEIDALQGAPGVISARYAGEHGDDAKNRQKVLQELHNSDNRAAQFRTVICYHDGIRTLFAEGICSGRISEDERGEGGFGYDCIFIPTGERSTFAEMSQTQKNAISHRRNALIMLRSILERYQE